MSEAKPLKAGLAATLAPWFDAWKPCDAGHQDRTATTAELVSMAASFNPLFWDATETLVELLLERGYKHTLVGDELRWLLKGES